MSKIAVSGNASGTGTFTITSPATNTDRTLNLPDEAGTVITSASDIESQVKTATNATGSAPIYACRAWVNFNGTTNTGGNCDIRASGNVSSVTDNGTGNYTLNFSTALVDDDYAVSGMGSGENTNGNRGANGFMLNNDANMLTTSCQVQYSYGSTDSSIGALMDPAIATIMVVR